MPLSIPIKKNKKPLKAGATGKSSNPNTLQRAKALRGISGAEAELVRARSNLRTHICQQKKKAKQTDEYAQLPDDKKESWLTDYVAAKTKRAVARVTEAEQDAEEERAHLKTIQEEKAAAQLEMTFEELMEDLGDDETTNNRRTCSLGDGSGGNGEGRVKLSKSAILHFMWLYRRIEQVSRVGYREAERYLNEAEKAKAKSRGSVTAAKTGEVTGAAEAGEATGAAETGEAMGAAETGEATGAAETGVATKTADKRKPSSGTAESRKKRGTGDGGEPAEKGMADVR